MSLPRSVLTALCALVLVALAPAQIRRAAAEAPPPPAEPLPWNELLVRDARIAFKKPPIDAQREITEGLLDPDGHALALFALGAAGELSEWPLLFSTAAEAEESQRRAAILAMGELALGVEDPLKEIATTAEEPFASDAVLALARTGRTSARRFVEDLAANPGPLSEAAAASLHFAIDPSGAHESPSARYLLELRWRSATRYGTIDGQTYEVHLLRELYEDEDFVDQLVLRFAAELPDPGVRDHLMGALLSQGGRGAVRGCVRAMPKQLAELMDHELWAPANEDEWDALLRELEYGEVSLIAAYDLILHAADDAPFAARALRLLAMVRDPDAPARIIDRFGEFLGEDRVIALSGLAHVDDAQVIDFLRGLQNDEDPRVRAQALAGRARGRDPEAREELRRVLYDIEAEGWRTQLEMACHHADNTEVQAMLETVLPRLEGREEVLVASVLSLQGRIGARIVLRGAVEEGLPQGILGGLAARAIGRRPNSEDILVIRRFFPLEGRPNENLELALALLRRKDRALNSILSAALWKGPFDRSVLTARTIVEVGNWLALKGELDNVPRTARSVDLRRVGFACGEWGGYPVLEWLEENRRHGSADPVLQGALLGMLSTRTQ